jgi:hypothetical protein
MLQKLSFFIVPLLFLFSGVFPATAQTAEDPQGGSTIPPPSRDAGGEPVPSETPPQEESAGGQASSDPAPVAPASPGEPATTQASPVTPRSVPVSSTTPVSPPVPLPNGVSPVPIVSPESGVVMPTPSPAPEISLPMSPDPEPSGIPFSLIAGTLVVLAGGGLLFLRGSNQNINKKKSLQEEKSPCDDLKQQYEIKKAEYEQSIKNTTLQELLIQGLEKKIEEMKGKVEGEVKGAIKKAGHKIKGEIIEKEKTGTLKEAVAVVEEGKETYDSIKAKYEQAKKLLETLQKFKAILAKEMGEREVAYNVCMAGGVLLSGVETGGLKIDLPERGAHKKIIFVSPATYIAAHKILEKYENRKFVLTHASGGAHASTKESEREYEIFVLQHEPEKTDRARHEDMLKHFGFIKDDKAKKSRDRGLKTLKELKEFLDENC